MRLNYNETIRLPLLRFKVAMFIRTSPSVSAFTFAFSLLLTINCYCFCNMAFNSPNHMNFSTLHRMRTACKSWQVLCTDAVKTLCNLVKTAYIWHVHIHMYVQTHNTHSHTHAQARTCYVISAKLSATLANTRARAK